MVWVERFFGRGLWQLWRQYSNDGTRPIYGSQHSMVGYQALDRRLELPTPKKNVSVSNKLHKNHKISMLYTVCVCIAIYVIYSHALKNGL